MAAWHGSTKGQRSTFPVRVVNNGERPYDVTLHLEGEGPGAESRLERLSEDIEPEEEEH